jgi:hypothetical protein
MKATTIDYRELLQEARRQGKKAIDPPRIYFSIASDPEYRKEQVRYVAAHIFPHGDIMRAITIAFVLAAYGSFAYGAWSCYVAFSASLPESGIKGPAFRQAPAAAKKP